MGSGVRLLVFESGPCPLGKRLHFRLLMREMGIALAESGWEDEMTDYSECSIHIHQLLSYY